MRFTAASLLFLVLSLGLSPAAEAPRVGPAVETAVFAAGCFWGVEAAFRRVPGVVETTAGYTGGRTINPTHEDVFRGGTGHVEAVRVVFDPARVSYAELLDVFWTCHDPTVEASADALPAASPNSAVFFGSVGQERAARASAGQVNAMRVFSGPVATRIVPAMRFYPAELYHQHFADRQAGGAGGSCHTGVATVHTPLAAEARAAREHRVAVARIGGTILPRE